MMYTKNDMLKYDKSIVIPACCFFSGRWVVSLMGYYYDKRASRITTQRLGLHSAKIIKSLQDLDSFC